MKTLTAAVFGVALCLCLAPAASADTAGLVGAYGFEEPTGTAAVDSSGAGNAGVFNGATRSASGRFGAAASFDGVNDRIDIADSNALDLSVGMTLEAWVRPTALGWRTAILKERPGGLAYGLYASTDNNRPSAEIQAETRAPAAIATNVWTHLATTYDGATLRLYVNGTQVSSRAVSGPITVSSGALRIGGNAVWSGEYFKGLIDEVRVYNRALSAGELAIDKDTAVVNPDTPPTAPTLSTSVAGGDDVHLSWTAATDNVGVTSYRVYRNGSLYATVGAGALSHDIVDELTGSVRYTVRAVDTAGQASTDSNEATVTIAPDTQAPTAPALTAAVSGDDVHLTWTAATDDRGVRRYQVMRSSDSHTVATVDAPALDAYDLDLPEGTYMYEVRAIDKAGNLGPASNVASATVGVPDVEPPTAPALTAALTGTSARLTWTASTDDKGIREYSIFRDGSLIAVVGPETRDFTDLNLPAYRTYRYTVRAVDIAGKPSPLSNEAVVELVDPDAQSPTAPVVTATIEGYDLHLTWTPATDDLGVEEYRIFNGSQLMATVSGSTTEWVQKRIPYGTKLYKVAAVDHSGHSGPSGEVTVVMDPATTPPVPVFDTPCDVKMRHSVEIQVYAPAMPSGSRTVWAEVDGNTVWGPQTNPPSDLKFTWRTWLHADGPHVMTVHVRQPDGTELVSEPCGLTVYNLVTATMAAPTDGATVSGVITLDADVSTGGERDLADWSGWYPARNPFGTVNFVIDGYPGFNPIARDVPWTATLDTRTLTNGPHTITAEVIHPYDGYVMARAQTITIDVDNSPPRPTFVRATATGDDVLVTWNAVTADPAVTGYRVFRDGTEIATVSDTSYTDADLPNGTYDYRVAAVNAKGVSGLSNPVSATVTVDETAPTITLLASCDGRRLSEYIGPVDASATDDRGGSVTVNVDVEDQHLLGPASVNGAFRFNWDTRKSSNGPHVITITARDASGNEAVKECPFTIQNSALSVPITGVADGDTVRGTIALGFQPRADGQAATAPARLVIDGVTVADTGSGPYTYDWNTAALADGLHTITAEMGWPGYPQPTMAETTIQVRVDNSLHAPTGVAASVDGDDVTVTWNAVAGATAYEIYRDGANVGFTGATSWTNTNVPVGTHDYKVVAVNRGQQSLPSEKVTVTIEPVADTTPPTVSLGPCDGTKVHDYVDLRPSVSDDQGPMTARVLLDGATIWGPYAVSAPRFQFVWDPRRDGVPNGMHTMTVVVRDGAGNETSVPCEWNVQNPAVTVPFSSPADGATVSGTVNLAVQVLADGAVPDWTGWLPAGNPVTGVSFEVVGKDGGVDTTAPYSWAWDTTKVPNGTYTLRAKVSWMDYSLPRATSEIQVTVDNPVAPPPSGLVAAYGFEQTAGTSVTDSSGKGSTGTLSGATWAAGGKFGRALSFDGVNDIVTVPDSSLLDLAPGMTLEAWVKPTTANGWRTVLLKERPGQLAYSLYATGDSGRPLTEITAGSQRDARGTAALPVGVWTHLAATYDKSTLRLYVNGTQVSSTAVTGTLFNSTGALRIGGNSVWGEYFSGLIDEVRVYERALSAAEIAADKDRAV